MSTETIFALASAPGRGGVAVIRISGAKAIDCLSMLTPNSPLPAPRQAAVRRLTHPVTGDLIDQALVLRFAAPNSFTGEDVIELHAHGGRAVTGTLLSTLAAMENCRLAEPGEFSRRAFEHGKLDLTEAEAIADLVDAETDAQRRQALRQMEGALGTLYHGWADSLVKSLAHLEAYLDFPDEPLPDQLERAHKAKIEKLISELTVHLTEGHRGQRLRDGIRVAILGLPNAGKSSLLNALAAREAAIVSPIAGTTRDVIELSLDIAGYPVLLQDTAGLRESDDQIEQEGVRRARAVAEDADLTILLFDASQPMPAEFGPYLNSPAALLVANKTDLAIAAAEHQGQKIISIIAAEQHIQPLHDALKNWLDTHYAPGEVPSLTRLRHRQALEQTLASLRRSQSAPTLELEAEDLRLAVRSLGTITGKVDVEQMLDIIFRDFCIGK